jgi:hypothetical protein
MSNFQPSLPQTSVHQQLANGYTVCQPSSDAPFDFHIMSVDRYIAHAARLGELCTVKEQ